MSLLFSTRIMQMMWWSCFLNEQTYLLLPYRNMTGLLPFLWLEVSCLKSKMQSIRRETLPPAIAFDINHCRQSDSILIYWFEKNLDWRLYARDPPSCCPCSVNTNLTVHHLEVSCKPTTEAVAVQSSDNPDFLPWL